jgi:DNA-binding response OmpR family regulator
MSPAPDSAFRILLVGDALVRPDGLERALARAGFRVAESNDVRLEPAGEQPPDVVLATLAEADSRLEETLDAVAYAFGPAVPTVVTLSSGGAGDLARALELGADDALLAPVHVPELLARLDRRKRAAGATTRHAAPDLLLTLDLLARVTGSHRRGELLQHLADRLTESLDLSRAAFVLTPGDSQGHVLAESPRADRRDLFIQLDRYPEIVRARQTGLPVLVRDAQTDPLFDQIRRDGGGQLPDAELRSVLAVPVRQDDRVAGVFLLRPQGVRGLVLPEMEAFVAGLERTSLAILGLTSGAEAGVAADAGPSPLEQRLGQEFSRAARYALGFSLVLLDVPDKEEADPAAVAGEIRWVLRQPDFVARYGKSEYAIVLPETSAEGARAAIHRVRSRFRDLVPGETAPSGEPALYAGIASYPHAAAERPEDLLALAEATLLRARRGAGERIAVAEPL